MPDIRAGSISMSGGQNNLTKTVRYLRSSAWFVYDLFEKLAGDGIEKACLVGSYRRGRPDIGDVDILVIPRSYAKCHEAALQMTSDRKLDSSGGSLEIGRLMGGIPFNIFYTTRESWGAALMYTTGSRGYNVAYRNYARSRGLRVNQRGVYRGSRLIPNSGYSERAVCRIIGIPWIPPEARSSKYAIHDVYARIPHGIGGASEPRFEV